MKKFTKEELQEIVNKCITVRQVCKEANVARDTFKKLCRVLDINTSHFNPFYYKKPRRFVEKICPVCKKTFSIAPYIAKKQVYCSNICANQISHIIWTPTKRSDFSERCKMLNKLNNRIPFSKTRKIVQKVNKTCPICSRAFQVCPSNKNKIYCSKNCYNSDKHHLYRKVGSGGYRKGSGRGKVGYYKGFWCDSTYELAYLIFMLDNGKKIERNLQGFKYIWEDREHIYFPDFIVDNKLVEIKGYKTELVEAKLKAVNIPIRILYKEDLKEVFEYVACKYNKSIEYLYELYDNHKPQYTYICSNCNKEFKTNHVRKTEIKFCMRKCINKHLLK